MKYVFLFLIIFLIDTGFAQSWAPSQIAAGEFHTCVVAEGDVHCFGRGDHGQLDVPPLNNPRQVIAGKQFTCALDDDGVHCWGDRSSGQLDVPDLMNPTSLSTDGSFICAIHDPGVRCWGKWHVTEEPISDLEIKDPWHIEVGYGNACVFTKDGPICWGGNSYGQLNHPELNNVRDIDFGNYKTCGIFGEEVLCWQGSRKYNSLERRIFPNPRQIAVGRSHQCVLHAAGVECWGDDDIYGNSKVPNLVNPREVVVGLSHSCALDDEGMKCWGGDAHSVFSSMPQFENVERLIMSSNTFFVFQDHHLSSWGKNRFVLDRPFEITQFKMNENRALLFDEQGHIYDQRFEKNSWASRTPPQDIGHFPSEISVGHYHACSLSEGKVFCWGGTPDQQQTKVPELKNPIKLVSEGIHSCVIDSGDVVCWGSSGFQFKNKPELRNPRDLATGSGHICALDDDGVKCWGGDSFGLSEVPGLIEPRAVYAASYNTCVLEKRGVICWGMPNSGINLVPELEEPEKVYMSSRHACALVKGRKLKCWGWQRFGQIDVPEELRFLPIIDVTHNLRYFAGYMYREKKDFILSLSRYAKDTNEGHQLAFYLAESFINGTNALHLQENIVPELNEFKETLKNKFKSESIIDVPRRNLLIEQALYSLTSLLQLLSPQVSDESKQQAGDITLAISDMIAKRDFTFEARRRLRTTVLNQHQFLSEISDIERFRAFRATLDLMLGWLILE